MKGDIQLRNNDGMNCGWCMQGMRVQEVVMCVHRFLDELGVDEVRQRGAADDKPLRMVKTLVHELCKCLVSLALQWSGSNCWIPVQLQACCPLSAATTMKQFMWQPDLMRVAQSIDAGVRRMREIDPSDGSDI